MRLTRAWVDEHCGDTTLLSEPMPEVECDALASELVMEWERTGEPDVPEVTELALALLQYSLGLLT